MVLKHNYSFLQLFAEAATGTDGGATGVKGAESAAVVQDSGVTAPAAGEKTGADNPVDRKAEYQRLVAEYKDIHDAEMQSVVQKRVRRSQEVADKYNALFPTIELVAERYGVDPHDTEALAKAVADDRSYYEEEAMKQGIPVENYMKMKQMERENAMYRQRDAQRAREEAAQKTMNGWLSQADAAKAVYPSLDLQVEMQSPEFVRLLQAGVPVRAAFEVVHKDDIISGAMRFAQNTAAEKLANSVASGQARPAEGGMGQAPTAQTKVDPSKLTLKEMEEQIRQAARGARISY